MKTITLTQNKVALVNSSDYGWLCRYKWRAARGRGSVWYAIRNVVMVSRGRRTLGIHRSIMGFGFGCKKQVDHIDGDGLNNQRVNLRVCTRSQNNRNREKTSRATTSKYKGVSHHKRNKKWCARIRTGSNLKHLGSFSSEKAAAHAYNEAAIEYFGEFARLNTLDSEAL